MLASTASAPRVTRCSLGLYWSRDLCSKHWLAGWGMSSYLGQILRGSEIWWFMISAHSLSTSLRVHWEPLHWWTWFPPLSILASAPALLHEVQLAQASIHVTCVCTYIDTMYISNLYMDQKSFEVPTMWPHARKRKYYLVHPVTQAQVSEVWREVWEMNITFCFKGTFCRKIFPCFEHCIVT